jgi:hypothetical protein
VNGLTLLILGFLFKYKELQAAQDDAAILLEQQRAREAEVARVVKSVPIVSPTRASATMKPVGSTRT